MRAARLGVRWSVESRGSWTRGARWIPLNGVAFPLALQVPVGVEIGVVLVAAGVVAVGLSVPAEASFTTVVAAGVTAGIDDTDRGKLVLVLDEVVDGSEAGSAAELPVLVSQRPWHAVVVVSVEVVPGTRPFWPVLALAVPVVVLVPVVVVPVPVVVVPVVVVAEVVVGGGCRSSWFRSSWCRWSWLRTAAQVVVVPVVVVPVVVVPVVVVPVVVVPVVVCRSWWCRWSSCRSWWLRSSSCQCP